MKPKVDPHAVRKNNAARLAADVAAFDAMCRPIAAGGQRHLQAPPLRLLPPTVSAGVLELRRSKRLGVAA